jgi:hypothetical protein
LDYPSGNLSIQPVRSARFYFLRIRPTLVISLISAA